jgi:hypothetical protein
LNSHLLFLPSSAGAPVVDDVDCVFLDWDHGVLRATAHPDSVHDPGIVATSACCFANTSWGCRSLLHFWDAIVWQGTWWSDFGVSVALWCCVLSQMARHVFRYSKVCDTAQPLCPEQIEKVETAQPSRYSASSAQ